MEGLRAAVPFPFVGGGRERSAGTCVFDLEEQRPLVVIIAHGVSRRALLPAGKAQQRSRQARRAEAAAVPSGSP